MPQITHRATLGEVLCTRYNYDKYHALYLEEAFPDIIIDALDEADVTKWFDNLNNRAGPGAANRVMMILNQMLNEAES